MWNNGHDAYLESRVFSAGPVELVHMLYQAAGQAVRDARHYLAQGEIADRSRCINKACEILMELTNSLDHKQGAEIARRLNQLYDYMLGQLIDANVRQADAPLAEVLGLLETLGEAWSASRPAPAMPPPQAQQSYASAGWSF